MSIDSLNELLSNRLSELEWYAKQEHLKVEPHLYPQYLFASAHSAGKRFKIEAYVEEIRSEIMRFKQLDSDLLKERLAAKILQKVSVLINSFKSQTLRHTKISSIESLMREVDPENDNIYLHLIQNKETPSGKSLQDKIKHLNHDKAALTATLKSKEQALNKTSTHDKDAILNSVLSLKQQIGKINQALSKLKEKMQEAVK